MRVVRCVRLGEPGGATGSRYTHTGTHARADMGTVVIVGNLDSKPDDIGYHNRMEIFSFADFLLVRS